MRGGGLVQPGDLVQVPALREALEAEAATVDEVDVLHRADQRLDGFGDEDLLRLRLRFDVLGDVHGGPAQVACLLRRLAGVDADAYLHLRVGVRTVSRTQRPLDGGGTVHRFPR